MFISAFLSLLELDNEISLIIEANKDSLEKEEGVECLEEFGTQYNLKPKSQNLKFYLKIAENLSILSDAICSHPRAGIINLGDICNLSRPVTKQDIHEWLMML